MNDLHIALIFISFLTVILITFFLYRGWLTSNLLSKVSKVQTYRLMRVFLYSVFFLALTVVALYAYLMPSKGSTSASLPEKPKTPIDINGAWAIRSISKPTKYPTAILLLNKNLPGALWQLDIPKGPSLTPIDQVKIDENKISFSIEDATITYTGMFNQGNLHLKKFSHGTIEEFSGVRNFDLLRKINEHKGIYTKRYQLQIDEQGIQSLAFGMNSNPLPSGGLLLSAGNKLNATIKSWDTATGRPFDNYTIEAHIPGTRNLSIGYSLSEKYDHTYSGNIVEVEADKNVFFIAEYFWDIATGFAGSFMNIGKIGGSEQNNLDYRKIQSFSLNETGYIATVEPLNAKSSAINIRLIESGNIILPITGFGSVTTTSINNSITRLAIADIKNIEGEDKIRLHILDIKKRKTLCKKTLPSKISLLKFSPADKLLASTTIHDKHISIWDISTCSIKLKIPIKEPPTPNNIILFSSDGKLLAFVNKTIVSFWDLNTGTLDHKINHEENISAIDFSIDDRVFATGSKESGTITLWTKE